jgi:hypothetical protein
MCGAGNFLWCELGRSTPKRGEGRLSRRSPPLLIACFEHSVSDLLLSTLIGVFFQFVSPRLGPTRPWFLSISS